MECPIVNSDSTPHGMLKSAHHVCVVAAGVHAPAVAALERDIYRFLDRQAVHVRPVMKRIQFRIKLDSENYVT